MATGIEFIGADKLNTEEKTLANKLCTEYYDKICRTLQNECKVVVHVKQHRKNEGKKVKYTVLVRAEPPTATFEAESSDWDLARTMHKTFKDIERQITHKLKCD